MPAPTPFSIIPSLLRFPYHGRRTPVFPQPLPPTPRPFPLLIAKELHFLQQMELCVIRDKCLQPLLLTVASNVGFRPLLQTLQMKLNDPTLERFEYVDEDEDHITVRCDEDLASLVDFYFSAVAPASASATSDAFDDNYPRMLKIYPRCGSQAPPPLLPSLNPAASAPRAPSPPLAKNDLSWMMPSAQSSSSLNVSDLEPLGEIGVGFCGRVWRARHRPSGEVVAVKSINIDVSSQTAQQQILRELSVLKRCGDEAASNIIRYLGAFFLDSAIHICTELMDAGSLERWLGRIPEPVLGRMSVQVVSGLCFLWSRRILHRDVKPSNMLVSRDGVVKLCDFGVSIELERSIALSFTGTYAYMSPERIAGEEYSVASDVWAFGVALFELGAGMLPFSSLSPTPIDLASKIMTMTAPPLLPGLSIHGVKLSSEMRDFVCGCMQRRPRDRLSADAELLEHPFYLIHSSPDNRSVVAQWVRCQDR